MHKLFGVLLLALLATLSAAPAAQSAPASASRTWVVSPSPHATGRLNSVVANTVVNVWAVGVTGGQKALSEHWNGTSWQLVKPVRPGKASDLTAVCGFSREQVVAVGYYTDAHNVDHGLVEQWNGMNWARLDIPNSLGARRLYAVSSGHDIWVGGVGASGHHVILRYNGTSWRGTRDVDFSGTAGDRIAGFTSHLSGSLWAIGDADNGTSSTAVLEQRVGWFNWKQGAQPTGTFTTLNGIGGHSYYDIWAVGSSGPAGSSHPIAVSDLSGKVTWLPVKTSAPSSMLMGVNARLSGHAWAVGSKTTSLGGTATLIEHYVRGTPSFTPVASPNPDANVDALTSISGYSAELWAVGYAGGSPLILHHTSTG